MSCGVGRRRGSDPALLRLWLWPAAVALIGPLAWEPPCASDVALKSRKNKIKPNQTKKPHTELSHVKKSLGVPVLVQ